MKRLYLLRHAKSSWKLDYLDDFERPLNKRGKKDAPLIGSVLRDLGVKPSIILSSPAARAASTARIVAAEIGYRLDEMRYDEHLYDAGVRDFMEIVGGLDDAHASAMLVSHDPGITMTAARLTGTAMEGIPTAGIVAVEFDVDAWRDVREGGGRIVFFEYPKKYRTDGESDEGESHDEG